jgi:undecaprenyl-diphosphatase
LNDFVLSGLLGVIEGLTEFLPVSSTAHLRIAEALLHLDLADGFWKTYTIVIQLGAILCLPIYFRGRIAGFLRSFPKGPNGDRTAFTHPLTLVILAFVMTAIPAFLLAKVIGEHLESLRIMGGALLLGGILMGLVDAVQARAEAAGPGEAEAGPATDAARTSAPAAAQGSPRSRIRTWNMESVKLWQALWIGLCQTLSAVFPGASRSMTTIAAGQIAGMSRSAALEFSFFLSIPTMAAATGYDLLKALHSGGAGGGISPDGHGWAVLAIGFLVSFLVAYAAVAWFMAWVRRRGFLPFALYRIVLGALVLLWAGRVGR